MIDVSSIPENTSDIRLMSCFSEKILITTFLGKHLKKLKISIFHFDQSNSAE